MNHFSAINLLTVILLLLPISLTKQARADAISDHQSPTVSHIYIIRHAEKQLGKDPSLTEEGLQRAENYGVLFSNLNIKQLFASKYKRNQETARPIAKALELELLPFDPINYTGFAERVKGMSGNSIVVAHSDLTVLLSALGASSEPEIDHEDYSRLYQITLLDKQFLSIQRLTSINR